MYKLLNRVGYKTEQVYEVQMFSLPSILCFASKGSNFIVIFVNSV